mgnify:FL=1
MYQRILVVCTGNICRSPMAEYLLRERLGQAGKSAEIRSAGVGALVGEPADQEAIERMQGVGIDLSPHRAQQATVSLCRWAELVLVMEPHHREALGDIDPTVRGKTFLLGYWGKFEIPDPYRRSAAAWDEAAALIDTGIGQWVARL